MPDYSGRKPKRQKCAPDQLILPFSSPEPLRVALRSIDHRVAEVGPKCMRQVCELVMAVWLCSQKNGCRAHRESLLAVAMRNSEPGNAVIGSLSAFKRALAAATRLGIVRSEQSNGPSEREVDEMRVAELVRISRERRVAGKCARGEPRVSHDCATGEPRPLLRQNLETNKTHKPKEPSERSPQLVQAVNDWLAYKAERRQGYKPTGLRVFQSRIDAWVREHGEAAVIADLQQSIASNWSGCGFSFGKNAASLQRNPLNGAVYDPNRSEADYEF